MKPLPPFNLNANSQAKFSSHELSESDRVHPTAIDASDRLSTTLFFAAALHAILILGIIFDGEDPANITPSPALEIIMLHNQQNNQSEQADYLADVSQDGGGSSAKRDRPSDPFMAIMPTAQDGIAPKRMEAGKPQDHRVSETSVLTRIHSQQKIELQANTPKTKQPRKNKLTKLDMQVARMTTELNHAKQTYARRPKKLHLTASTQSYVAAGYMARWVEKIERIGNLNLPDAAQRNKLSGSLILEVEIKRDGSLVEVKIIHSSGHQILDDAAKRIVSLSTPFEVFPPKLRAQADHLEIVRTWEFTQTRLTTR